MEESEKTEEGKKTSAGSWGHWYHHRIGGFLLPGNTKAMYVACKAEAGWFMSCHRHCRPSNLGFFGSFQGTVTSLNSSRGMRHPKANDIPGQGRDSTKQEGCLLPEEFLCLPDPHRELLGWWREHRWLGPASWQCPEPFSNSSGCIRATILIQNLHASL